MGHQDENGDPQEGDDGANCVRENNNGRFICLYMLLNYRIARDRYFLSVS